MKCYKYWRMFRCEGCRRVEYHRVVCVGGFRWAYVCQHCGQGEDKALCDLLLSQEPTVPHFLHINISENYIRPASEFGMCERCLDDKVYIGKLWQGHQLCQRDRAYAVGRWGEL